jgi:hypothetical protein
LAPAVPEVQTRTAGCPVALAIPKAKKAAERSSRTGIASISSCWAKAIARGVERDPGQIIAMVNPKHFRVSARMEAQTVLVLRKSTGIIPFHFKQAIHNYLVIGN